MKALPKSSLHPLRTDFKTSELFPSIKALGITFLVGKTVQMTPEEWEDFKADGDAIVKAHQARHAAATN